MRRWASLRKWIYTEKYRNNFLKKLYPQHFILQSVVPLSMLRLLINPSFLSVFYKCQKKNRVYRQVHLRLWSYHFSSFDTVDGLQVSPFAPSKSIVSSQTHEHALRPYGFSWRETYVLNSGPYHGLTPSFMGYVRDLKAIPWVISIEFTCRYLRCYTWNIESGQNVTV